MTKTSPSYRSDTEVTFGHLVLLFGLAVLLGVFASMFFIPIVKLIVHDKVYQSILSGALVSLSAFLLPPLVLKGFALAKREPFFLRFTVPSPTLSSAGKALVIMLLMLPVSSFFGWVMSLFPIPETLIPVQEAVEAETAMILGEQRPVGILLVVLFLSVVAPFSEEYFFRGGLMGWLISKTKLTHPWVWAVALVFSLAHFEWNGLIARFLMGAVLGYVALYGGLPMAILTHALNNLFVYLLYLIFGIEDPFIPAGGEVALPQILFLSLAALLSLSLLFYLLRKLKPASDL